MVFRQGLVFSMFSRLFCGKSGSGVQALKPFRCRPPSHRGTQDAFTLKTAECFVTRNLLCKYVDSSLIENQAITEDFAST